MSEYFYIIDRFDHLGYGDVTSLLEANDTLQWIQNPTILSAVHDVMARLVNLRGEVTKFKHFTGNVVHSTDIPTFLTNTYQYLTHINCPYLNLFNGQQEMFSDSDGIGLFFDYITSELQYELLHRYNAFTSSATISSLMLTEDVPSSGKITPDEFKLDADFSPPALFPYLFITMSNIHSFLYNLDIYKYMKDGKKGTFPINNYMFNLLPTHQSQLINDRVAMYHEQAVRDNPQLVELLKSSNPSNLLFDINPSTLSPAYREVLSAISKQLYRDYVARRKVVLHKMSVMTQTFLFTIKYRYLRKLNMISAKGVAYNEKSLGKYTLEDAEYMETVDKIRHDFSQILRQMTYTFPATILDTRYLTTFHPKLLTHVNLRLLFITRNTSQLMASHPKLHLLHRMSDRGGRIDPPSNRIDPPGGRRNRAARGDRGGPAGDSDATLKSDGKNNNEINTSKKGRNKKRDGKDKAPLKQTEDAPDAGTVPITVATTTAPTIVAATVVSPSTTPKAPTNEAAISPQAVSATVVGPTIVTPTVVSPTIVSATTIPAESQHKVNDAVTAPVVLSVTREALPNSSGGGRGRGRGRGRGGRGGRQ